MRWYILRSMDHPATGTKAEAMTILEVPDSPKMLRETLCEAQSLFTTWMPAGYEHHVVCIQHLVNELDNLRPLGPDGKHGELHTESCGCEDKPHGWWCDPDCKHERARYAEYLKTDPKG